MYYSQVLGQKTDFFSNYLNESIVNLLDTTFQIPKDYSVHLYQVEEEYTARPDLLSLDLYGDEMYADILCKLNGISNPYELMAGQYILVPDFTALEWFNVIPAVEWSEPNTPENSQINQALLPILKRRTQKRKPNEAIVGDSRFNIDPISKIVIY